MTASSRWVQTLLLGLFLDVPVQNGVQVGTPVPPPITSPLPPSNAENIPPACCSNPPPPHTPLVPIEEVMSDAEDSDAIAKRAEEALDEEVALSFLNWNNQS